MNTSVVAVEIEAPAVNVSVVGAVAGNGYTTGIAKLFNGRSVSDELSDVLNVMLVALFTGGMIITATASVGTVNTFAPEDKATESVSSTVAVFVIVSGPNTRWPCASPALMPLITSVAPAMLNILR